MMMRDENDAHVTNIEPRLGDAASHTIASVEDIKRAINDQQIRELCAMGSRGWAGHCSECDQTRRREILLPESAQPENARPIRSESRALLVASIARGRRWLDELIADPAATTGGRLRPEHEGCTTRKINMTISLAFLAPDLVKAAIDGQLPHGMGVARLADLSAEWCRQRQMLGLPVL